MAVREAGAGLEGLRVARVSPQLMVDLEAQVPLAIAPPPFSIRSDLATQVMAQLGRLARAVAPVFSVEERQVLLTSTPGRAAAAAGRLQTATEGVAGEQRATMEPTRRAVVSGTCQEWMEATAPATVSIPARQAVVAVAEALRAGREATARRAWADLWPSQCWSL
jgi:hypothetical protein